MKPGKKIQRRQTREAKHFESMMNAAKKYTAKRLDGGYHRPGSGKKVS